MLFRKETRKKNINTFSNAISGLLIKKRSKSPNIQLKAPYLSDEEEDNSFDDQQSNLDEICFEDYIEMIEPKQHRRELLLHIAPLLRNGKYSLWDISYIINKPYDRLKKFLDQYENMICSILHE
jgi:hypothetical protein